MPLSAIQPDRYEELLAVKCDTVATLLRPYYAGEFDIVPSAPTGFRMRAEFRVWHDGDALDYVMFRRDDPKNPVPINDFPIACPAIRQLMPVLREQLAESTELRRKLFQVEFLATLSGDMLVTLVYHRRLEDDWELAAQALRERLSTEAPALSLIGRSRRQKSVLGRDWVEECLSVDGDTFRFNQYEQAFTQPNARVNEKMIEWACHQARARDGDLLELYCGNGNFTLPLARHFDRVIATELAKTSVRAARENIALNGTGNVQIIRLAAEEVTQAINRERAFRRLAELERPLHEYDLRTVFVDPPRAGLDSATVAMVSRFEAILYISCNPHTLANNLSVLQGSHRVQRMALFDQFPYTDHMECGALLQRR